MAPVRTTSISPSRLDDEAPTRARPAMPSLAEFDGGTIQSCGRESGRLMGVLARAGVLASFATVVAITMAGFPYARIGGPATASASLPPETNLAGSFGGADSSSDPIGVPSGLAFKVPSLEMVEIASRLVSIEANDRTAGDDLFALVDAEAKACEAMQEGRGCRIAGPGFVFDFGGGEYAIGDAVTARLAGVERPSSSDFGEIVMFEGLGSTIPEDVAFVEAVDAAYEAIGTERASIDAGPVEEGIEAWDDVDQEHEGSSFSMR